MARATWPLIAVTTLTARKLSAPRPGQWQVEAMTPVCSEKVQRTPVDSCLILVIRLIEAVNAD